MCVEKMFYKTLLKDISMFNRYVCVVVYYNIWLPFNVLIIFFGIKANDMKTFAIMKSLTWIFVEEFFIITKILAFVSA